MASHSFHSRRKLYFQITLWIFIISILGYISLKAGGFFLHQRMVDQKATLSGQNVIVASYTSLTGYTKLQAVKSLETQQEDIPRADHIKKIITMLESLKNVQSSTTDMIALSDFKVDLNEISLKGKVSQLALLYASDPVTKAPSLWDRFSSLDFIKDMNIQTYDKVGDNDYFEFVLHAKVLNNVGK